MAVAYFFVTACAKVYDSRSVISLSAIFGEESGAVKQLVAFQALTATLVLVALSFVQTRVKKI